MLQRRAWQLRSQQSWLPAPGDGSGGETNILPSDPITMNLPISTARFAPARPARFVGFGACDKSDKTDITVNQNLAPYAAFALYSEELQQSLLSGDYDKMSVDLRMASLNNGYEHF